MKKAAMHPLRIALPTRIGVSRCLLGEEVRYDGGHKRDQFLTDVLGRYVEWVPDLSGSRGRIGDAARADAAGR